MNTPHGQPSGPTTSPSVWPMYRAMVGVGLVCGVLIVSVFQWTRPIIEHKKAAALQRAIFTVLPSATSSATFRFDAQEHFQLGQVAGPGEQLVYAGYDDAQQLVGVAIEARGMGYQDVIRLLYGYSVTDDAIIGVHVLDSKETPGLGDRIEKDALFLENFTHLDVTLSTDLSQLQHPIEAVKHGRKEHAWQIDGITGATVSSMAVANLLNNSASWWIPRLRRNWDEFRKAGENHAQQPDA